MKRENLLLILAKVIPEEAAPLIADWIQFHNIHLHISEHRNSKLGDYTPPHRGKTHKITINHNLNKYEFLITLVHEIAHLTTWNKFQNKVNPHGKEWKQEFTQLIRPFQQLLIFPDDLKHALHEYFINPAASSCSDEALSRALRRYDKRKEHVITVEQVPMGAIFRLRNGMEFRKGELLRKRYRCMEINKKAVYLVSGLADCVLIESVH